MLFTIDGDRITQIPRTRLPYFRAVAQLLGDVRTDEVRTEFNRLIDTMVPDQKTGLRTFSSSYLGSNLSPWPYPLAHLYDAAVEMAGPDISEREIQEQAGFSFGLFAWDCMMARDEKWAFYDPNMQSDPNKEITGKIYFERS